MTTYTPCGGCGADHPDKRCIGCWHPFTNPAHPTPPQPEPEPSEDVVARLRKSAAAWKDGPYVKLSTARQEATEAADEIERLRGLLVAAVGPCPAYPGWPAEEWKRAEMTIAQRRAWADQDRD